MDRVVVAVDSETGMSPAEFASAWDEDAEAAVYGSARVEPGGGAVLLPGVIEFVVLPLAVSLLSSVVYDLVKRVAARNSKREVSELELVEFTSGGGDRVLVVRSRRMVS